MNFDSIDSINTLRELYGNPMELALKKQHRTLDKYSKQFLSMSTFCTLSTSNANGDMDCSPRGDYPGFIQILSKNTIALPDRPGNNRLDSLCNIIENPNIGILILTPGFKECLRINGTAKVVTDNDLLKRFEHQGKLPKTAIVISIKEIYFHCTKAIVRSRLWDPKIHENRELMPSLGKILMEQISPSSSEEEIKKIDTLIESRAKKTLY